MDLIIISSAINTCSAPLSYYPVRSVFPKEERFQQTFKTIESIKKIPNKRVSFVECTEIPQEYEEEIKAKVDFYKNIYKGNESIIDGLYKNVGEALSILSIDKDGYENIYKISGRYYLTDEFDYSKWDNNDSMMWVDNKNGWRLTVFYKINKIVYPQWINILTSMVQNNESRAIEERMMGITNFKKIEKVGVEGYTHGGCLAKF